MKPKITLLSVFSKEDQLILEKCATESDDEFHSAMLSFPSDMSVQVAQEFVNFVINIIPEYTNHIINKSENIFPDELSSLYKTAKKLIEDLGFEYEWYKTELSEERELEYRDFYDDMCKKGIEFSNIVINKTPENKLEALLDYGGYTDVFYFEDNKKENLKRFNLYQEAIEYYQSLLLDKPHYYLRKVHYKNEEEKEAALYYAKELNDDVAYDILNNNTQITSEETAFHLSLFFWKMVDKSAEDYHSNFDMGNASYGIIEDLMNTIGGFVISSGYHYQWYREELSSDRVNAAKLLKNELIESGIDMTKVIINHEPKEKCYCFLDYGDYREIFYYLNDEEEPPEDMFRCKDFEESITYFKDWVLKRLG